MREEEEDNEDQMLRSPMQINARADLLGNEMDQKENTCSAQEVDLGISSQRKRNRKGRGCNLRKSLAWNQAFFTDEGVLDPLELSRLNKSSTNSSGNQMLVKEMSPLTTYNKSSVRPPLRNLNSNSQCRDPNSRKLFHSRNVEPEAHTTSGKTSSSKGILKSIPRSPTTNSQKRVANASSSNSTSKVPKLPANPITSGNNTIMAINSSKSNKNAIKANVGQNASVRTPVATNFLACSSSSSNFSAEIHQKSLVKEGSNSLSSVKYEGVTCGPSKVTNPLLRTINNIPKIPVPSQARPSALRMPSPSLGFFCQGKVSPSYVNQQQRLSQHTQSKISPIGQPKNMRQNSQLRHLPSSFHQQPAEATAAKHSSCLNPSATQNTCIHVETNLEMKQTYIVDMTVNHNSSDCQNDSSPLKVTNDSFVQDMRPFTNNNIGNVCDAPVQDSNRIDVSCTNESEEECDMKVEVDIPGNVCDAPVGDSNKIDVSCTNVVHVECDTKEVKVNTSGSTPDASVLGSNLIDVSCSTKSQVDCDLKEVQIDALLKNTAALPHDDARDEICLIATESKLMDGNSNLASDLVPEYIAKMNVLNALIETKPSPKEENRKIEILTNLKSNCSFLLSSEAYDQVAMNSTLLEQSDSYIDEMDLQDSHCDSTSMITSLSEKSGTNWDGVKLQDSHFEFTNTISSFSEKTDTNFDVMEIQDSHCESTNLISSTKSELLNYRKKMDTDTSRQEVLLNVVPFSDEWVAVLEAFGEDILEKKSGAVQNSPPDKALPEPSPWSPVKKKAQDVGPFDCTKYTKNITPTAD